MKHKMKWLFFFLCIMLLTSCNSGSANEKNLTYSPVAETYTFSDATISDMVQYEEQLIAVKEGGLLVYNCVSGACSEVPLDISADTCISLNGTSLYLFDMNRTTVLELDISDFSEKNTYQPQPSAYHIEQFAAGEAYLLFYGQDAEGFAFLIMSKETGQTEIVNSSFDVRAMTAMYEDKVVLSIGGRSSDDSCITIYNMADDHFSDKYYTKDISTGDIAYNAKENTVKFGNGDGGNYLVRSLSLEDGTISTVAILADSYENQPLLGTYANLTVVCDAQNTLQYYDSTAEVPGISVATVGYMPDMVAEMMKQYSLENDCLIREVRYENEETFKLKLMAGDTDIDVYLLSDTSTCIADFVRNEAYVDLWTCSEIMEATDPSDAFLTTTAVTSDGRLFGIPVEMYTRSSEDLYYSTLISKYQSDYVDLVSQTYGDEDGSGMIEFLNACRSYYENGKVPPADREMYTEVQCSYLMINPNAEHKDISASFLAYAYEVLSGKISVGEEWMVYQYPALSGEVYCSWPFYKNELYATVREAAGKATATDTDIGTIAKEAVNTIKMIIME